MKYWGPSISGQQWSWDNCNNLKSPDTNSTYTNKNCIARSLVCLDIIIRLIVEFGKQVENKYHIKIKIGHMETRANGIEMPLKMPHKP